MSDIEATPRKIDPWASPSERADTEAFNKYAAVSMALDANKVIDAMDLQGNEADTYVVMARELVDETTHSLTDDLEAAGFDAGEKLDEYRKECRWAGEEDAIARYEACKADERAARKRKAEIKRSAMCAADTAGAM